MRGAEGFSDDVAKQRKAIGARVPVYDRLLALALDDQIVARLDEAWREREFRIFYDRPLLLLASLRFAALAGDHPLEEALRDEEPRLEAATVENLRAAFESPSLIASLRERVVQTNETSRAVAWRWPAALLPAPPLLLADVGCAAGLNLIADRLSLSWTIDGEPAPAHDGKNIVARVGFDARPLDARAPDGARWLRACIWAGERERVQRLDEALRALAIDPPQLETAQASAVPAALDRLRAERPDALVLAYQTVVREYLPHQEREDYFAGMRDFVRAGRALWIELEAEPDRVIRASAKPAAIIAHLPDGSEHVLARCDYHPSDLRPDDDGVRALVSAFA